jgi:hypothetical protein
VSKADTPKAQPNSSRVRVAPWVAASVVLLCGAVLMLPACSVVFGHFIIASAWWKKCELFARVAGLILAVLFGWTAWKIEDRNAQRGTKARPVLAPIIMAFLGFIVGESHGSLDIPLLEALVHGKTTEITFQIKTVDTTGFRGCHPSIRLSDLPFVSNSLCNFPRELVASLSPGDNLVVTGMGTPIGLFVESARRVGGP